MVSVLASELSNKRVLSTDGQSLGFLHSVTMDTGSGALDTIVIETERTEAFGIEAGEDGHIRLPATLLSTVSDHLVVDPLTERE